MEKEKFDNFENEQGYPVNGATDLPNSNVLEKGRYKFTVTKMRKWKSAQQGNPCVEPTLEIDEHTVKDCFVLNNTIGQARWRQFLYAIGIRDKRKFFNVTDDMIIGKSGTADVVIKDRKYQDGSTSPENKVQMYSLIGEQVAPIADVPEETTQSKSTPMPNTKIEPPEQKEESLEDM